MHKELMQVLVIKPFEKWGRGVAMAAGWWETVQCLMQLQGMMECWVIRGLFAVSKIVCIQSCIQVTSCNCMSEYNWRVNWVLMGWSNNYSALQYGHGGARRGLWPCHWRILHGLSLMVLGHLDLKTIDFLAISLIFIPSLFHKLKCCCSKSFFFFLSLSDKKLEQRNSLWSFYWVAHSLIG